MLAIDLLVAEAYNTSPHPQCNINPITSNIENLGGPGDEAMSFYIPSSVGGGACL